MCNAEARFHAMKDFQGQLQEEILAIGRDKARKSMGYWHTRNPITTMQSRSGVQKSWQFCFGNHQKFVTLNIDLNTPISIPYA